MEELKNVSLAAYEHTIYRVHKHLRDVSQKAYEPEIIAIGPYHRRKVTLKMMEEHKSRYLHLLLERKYQRVEMYTEAIRELEPAVRNCYAEPISLNSDEFIEMLVWDGCFIVELLRKFDDNRARQYDDPVFMMEWIRNSLQRDLLLFENQIPFFVLCRLFDFIEGPGQYRKLIHLVVEFWNNLFPGENPKRERDINKELDYHLLDLVHKCFCCRWTDDHVIDIAGDCNNSVYKYFCCRRTDDYVLDTAGDGHMKGESIIPSATELTNANVMFKNKKKFGSLFDVEFKNGIMLMPPLTIEDRTDCFLRNLIAYEHYFPDSQPNYVADYARLLNCLIDSPTDVGVLSQAGIIKNLLGDHKVVCKLVNRLTETVSYGSCGDFVYAATFDNISNHYKKRWNRACAVLKRDYFNSPWAYATFLAALAILVLSVIQTACSVLQLLGIPQSST